MARLIARQSYTVNAADVSSAATYLGPVSMDLGGHRARWILVILQAENVAGGDATSKITFQIAGMRDGADDKTDPYHRHYLYVHWNDNTDATAMDLVSGASPGSKQYGGLAKYSLSKPVVAPPLIVALLSNSGTAYTGGTVNVIIEAFSET